MVLISVVIKFIPVIIAIIAHELAHAWVANKLGDNTAKRYKRLSLNPLRHIDWFGTFVLPTILVLSKVGFVFGWAKPIPINYRKFKKFRRDIILVSMAGIVMNLYLALLSALFLYLSSFVSNPYMQAMLNMFWINMVVVNIILAVFNLLPIPPLDGSKIFFGWVNKPWAIKYVNAEKQGLVAIVILAFIIPILIGYLGINFNIFGWYLIKTTNALASLLL